MNHKKKVFLGVSNTAGICSRLKKGFESIGIEADYYSFSEHIFGYKSDKIISFSKFSLIRKFQKVFLMTKLIIKYDYFIFDSIFTMLTDYADIKLLQKFGRKAILIFTGCDVRAPEKVIGYKWNPCRDCIEEYKRFTGCFYLERKKKFVRAIENVFDIIVCPQEASGFLVRDFTKAYFPINLEDFPKEKFQSYHSKSKLRILHAPSNPVYKGSQYIYTAIEKLKSEFDFEFKVVTGVTIDVLYNEINNSDLIIDQVLVGNYGLFAIESMAMYKPVVCYVREDSWNDIKEDCPVFNADPDSLYEVLKKILSNPSQLAEAGKRSREFVEKYHDASKIVKQYLELFENNN